ncbi:hypothetical protein E2C01_084827 [Portunus trituberculatus]|uniref:Uncharacterized protein n=1 Tax=Portunus trituberculatus TaxID=210409 RepID=A0A5B7J519_PORTR|nr:hypothetical protein [Portunus trituberculatus]
MDASRRHDPSTAETKTPMKVAASVSSLLEEECVSGDPEGDGFSPRRANSEQAAVGVWREVRVSAGPVSRGGQSSVSVCTGTCFPFV